MNITYDTNHSVMCARLSGSIDTQALGLFSQETTLQSRDRDVVLDLSAVDFMDSAGLSALVMLIRNYQESGRKCVLAAAPPIVAKTLKLTAINQLTPVIDNLNAAFDLLEGK